MESVPVRCPACRRQAAFAPPTYPCACGAPLPLPVLRGGVPIVVQHRSWEDSWLSMRCPDCGRSDQWPQPELGCACGAVIRLPVDTHALTVAADPPGVQTPGAAAAAAAAASAAAVASGTAAPGAGPERGAPELSPQRPPFRPVTIRTARDALTAAAQYLKWLGFAGVRIAGDRSPTGVDLRGDGVVGQVDPSTQPTPLRDVECLWLNCLNEDAAGAFFSLAGYARDARLRADQLVVPLFVMDLTGTPQPVNDAAADRIRAVPER